MENQTLESLLRQYINNSMNNMFTSMPGRVVKVNNLGEQRVDVQPLVSRVTPDDGTLDHPVILSVPLVFPGSRSSQFSFPVEIGDTVLLVFSQRSIQRFKQGAETPHKPISLSKYSRNDAMAIPGLQSFPSASNQPSRRTLSHSTEDTVTAHNLNGGQECEVRLKSDGSIEVNTAANVPISFNIGGQKVLELTSSGASFTVPVTAPEVTTDAGVDLNSHTHSQPRDSNNDVEGETNPPTV